MQLVFEPRSGIHDRGEDVELAVTVDSEAVPEVHTPAGTPRPDRHYLVGLAQSLAVAAEEEDPEMVEFIPDFTLGFLDSPNTAQLRPTMVILRFGSGRMALISAMAPNETARMMRKVVRAFTGGVRLDIP